MGITMCSCDKKIKNELVKDDLIVNIPINNNINDDNKFENLPINNNNIIKKNINITIPGRVNSKKEKKIKENESNKENGNDLMSVNSIIPEKKLHSKNNNEIMFIGDLQYFENENLISSFATLTRLNLNFYKDKAQFISMKKPISSLNLNQMLNADLTKDNDNNLFLCITLIENQEKKIYQIKTKELLFKWLCVLNYFIPLSQTN